MSPFVLSTDLAGEEVGSEHSEVEQMGKDGSVEGWEGTCWPGEMGACGMGGEETLVESEMCICGGEERECSEAVGEMGESASSTVGGESVLEGNEGWLAADSARMTVVA